MNNESPLVSVGIPAYNKPEGLRRTLQCITRQTYKNLEIIISDDCSLDKETETVSREFMAKDERIQFIRHAQRRGAEFNFQFTLKKARGEFFMWVADDYERDERFIEVCISKIENCSSAMPEYKFINRAKRREFRINIPDLSPQYGVYRNLRNYMTLHPSVFTYGLHKRADILWLLEWRLFDAWDHHFVSKLLLDCNGIMLVRGYCGFTVGIDAKKYIPKPVNPRPGRLFEHFPLLRHNALLFASSNKLSGIEKITLVRMAFREFLESFANCEKNARPVRAKLCQFVLMLISGMKKLTALLRNGEQELVSIIIPAYNAEKYIKEAIDSALAQTYKNIEIIVVDDGSTDNTRNIVASYKDPKIRLIAHENNENHGTCKSRYLGYVNSHGEYIAFLDADDIFLPEKIEKQVGFLEKSTAILTHCKAILKNESSAPYTRNFSMGMNIKQYNLIKDTYYLSRNDFCPSAALIRAESLKSIDFNIDKFSAAEDWCVWVCLSVQTKKDFLYTPEPLFKYRISEDSWTFKASRSVALQLQCKLGFLLKLKAHIKDPAILGDIDKAILKTQEAVKRKS